MPTWLRTIKPQRVTPPSLPGPQIAAAQSGKINTRATTQVGMAWVERYLIDNSDADARTLVAQIRDYNRRGASFDIDLQWNLTPLGSTGGTPLVNGASQTGTTINIDGATASQTPWIKGGDVVTFAGLTLVYEITADANSDGSGLVVLPISPAIFSGGSPANNAAVTVTGVVAQAIVVGYDGGDMKPDEFSIWTVAFQEAP